MSGWKRLYPKPAGSLPGGIVTQWGVALITVLLLIFIGMWLASGGGETALETAVADVAAPARNFAGQMAAAVEAEAMRAETRRSAAERAMQAQQRQEALEAGSAIGPGQVRLDEARLLAGASPDTGEAYTEEEWELRERLRLEALERRARSLRSSPVAQTYRQLDRGGGSVVDVQEAAAEAVRTEGAEAIARALGTFEGVAERLEDDIAAEAEADRAFLAALTGGAAGTPGNTPGMAPGASNVAGSGAGGELLAPGAPVAPPAPMRDYNNPAQVETPDDPPGWERIYEGSFLEGVLVTQLSGDFPAPVLAQVAVPFLQCRPATDSHSTRIACHRNGGGSHRARSGAAGRWLPSLDPARRPLDRLTVSRPESGWRGGLEGSRRPPLLLDVRGGRSGRGD